MKFDTYSRAEVLARLFEAWHFETPEETAPLDEAAGRITACEIRSRLTLPVCRASAMDGIAVNAAAIAAGDRKNYARTDTGDDFGDEYDAVIKIEDVVFGADGSFAIAEGLELKPGMNVQPRGAAIEEGEAILEAGLPIRPCDLAALARGGITDVPVRSRPIAAFIPTGNELVPPGIIPERGENIDTNSIMAKHMLAQMGAVPVMFPIIKDRRRELQAALEQALESADIVIINGGSSKGADDFNARLLFDGFDSTRVKKICHGVNAAPGRPLAIALVNGKPVVCLPGPMLAAYFGLDWCVRAIAARYLGVPARKRPVVRAVLTDDIFPAGELPHDFEYLTRLILTRASDPASSPPWEAWPVPLGRAAGRRTLGFHSGFYAARGDKPYTKGGVIDAELCYGEEWG